MIPVSEPFLDLTEWREWLSEIPKVILKEVGGDPRVHPTLALEVVTTALNPVPRPCSKPAIGTLISLSHGGWTLKSWRHLLYHAVPSWVAPKTETEEGASHGGGNYILKVFSPCLSSSPTPYTHIPICTPNRKLSPGKDLICLVHHSSAC